VNYLDGFKIREIPCRVKAEHLLCRVNGYSETDQIVHWVWLVVEGADDLDVFKAHRLVYH